MIARPFVVGGEAVVGLRCSFDIRLLGLRYRKSTSRHRPLLRSPWLNVTLQRTSQISMRHVARSSSSKPSERASPIARCALAAQNEHPSTICPHGDNIPASKRANRKSFSAGFGELRTRSRSKAMPALLRVALELFQGVATQPRRTTILRFNNI